MVQFSIFGIVFCWFTLFHLAFCCFGWLFRYLIPFLTNCSYLNILYVLNLFVVMSVALLNSQLSILNSQFRMTLWVTTLLDVWRRRK